MTRQSDDAAPALHPDTLLVHAGRKVDSETGAVTLPIHPSTTFERDPDGGYSRGHVYTRQSNPNRAQLEQCLAALEGGDDACAFASGSAATMAVLQLLCPGDHVVLTEDCYYGTRHQLETLFTQWGLTFTRVDTTDVDAVAAAIEPASRLLWIESPSNPLLRISDLEALAQLAREHDLITACDNTVATPVLQNPLHHGIDLVVHSTTKFLGGHSDLLGGAVIQRADFPHAPALRNIQVAGGAVPAAFDCWLLLRSISSLGVRVRAQAASARTLAQRLQGCAAVEAVFHPMLAEQPHHERAQYYLPGGCGLLSFTLNGGEARARQIAAATRVFTCATSLGSVESLIEHRASIEGAGTPTPNNLLRLSVGLEDVEDLWRDLEQTLRS